MLDPKTLQKRKVEATSGRSACIRVELLPAPPTSEIQESDPHNIEDLKVERVPYYLDLPISKEGLEISVEYLFSEVILSLPVPDISDFFSEKDPTKRAETSRTVMNGVQLTEAMETPGLHRLVPPALLVLLGPHHPVYSSKPLL